jgi:hypothetical protein
MRATTCIPGPVGGSVRYSPYSLGWIPATDNVTPKNEIIYLVYEASIAGGEDFSRPTYMTSAGATSFTTPLLPDNVSHYFVVRAMDGTGNRDTERGRASRHEPLPLDVGPGKVGPADRWSVAEG